MTVLNFERPIHFQTKYLNYWHPPVTHNQSNAKSKSFCLEWLNGLFEQRVLPVRRLPCACVIDYISRKVVVWAWSRTFEALTSVKWKCWAHARCTSIQNRSQGKGSTPPTSQVFGSINPYYRIELVRRPRLCYFWSNQRHRALRVLSREESRLGQIAPCWSIGRQTNSTQ